MSFMTFVTMTPLGRGVSVSSYVARVVEVIDKSGIPCQVTPMGTIIEGQSWTEVMNVLGKGFKQLQHDCDRVSIVIKIDYRKGRSNRLKTKIQSLENKVGKSLS